MDTARNGEVVPVSRLVDQGRGGSRVQRILLGAQLRRLREARGLKLEEAGREIRASEAKMSRLELGRVGVKERDVADLLTLYGVEDEAERAQYLTLAQRANAPDWWRQYGDVLPSWFEMHLGLEDAASLIRMYQVQFIPGLFQVPEYAEAVIRLAGPAVPRAEVERKLALRMARQELLSRAEAPRMWAIIDEAALRRPLGGPEVMRRQIDRLIQISRMPNVTLQVLPFSAGGHAAAGGPVTILRFNQPDLPDIVYLEQLASAVYLDKRDDVDTYANLMDSLSVAAEPGSASVALLKRIASEF